LSVLTPSSSFAAVNGVSVAATYPTPQGFAYQTLSSLVGFQGEAWIDSPSFFSHIFPQMHLALIYEPFAVRGLSSTNLTTLGITTGLGVTTVGTFVGVVAQSGDYGHSSVDLGAVFDTMTYVNSSSVNSNSGAAFAAQLVPGFDLPITSRVGVLVELPFKIYNLKNTLAIWDVVAGVRLKL
jgi:hypothetical protein